MLGGHYPEAWSQSLIMDGFYDCQRATNGRPYCRRQGYGTQYFAKSEDFFAAFEVARSGSPIIQYNNVPVVEKNNNIEIVSIKTEISDIKGQIDLMNMVVVEQRKYLVSGNYNTYVVQETITVIEERLVILKSNLKLKAKNLSNYVTSIRPDDMDLGISARKSSEIYPKVPYYIAGTKETGEFWVEPNVTDSGKLMFKFKFVDISSLVEKVRSSIDMTVDDLERTQKALIKIAANSKVAHEKKIRRKVNVRMDCFPISDCPSEGEKLDGRSSTEIIFGVSEDGATNGRIQRNKGLYEEGYNFSKDSALLLQAYINHVLLESKSDFEAGSATNEDVKNMFR